MRNDNKLIYLNPTIVRDAFERARIKCALREHLYNVQLATKQLKCKERRETITVEFELEVK
jgi:hypothetical protein